MEATQADPKRTCHLVALPYPGRGHINPMMNFCKLIAITRPNFLISFIITEEWHSLIASDPKPPNIHYATIPNVLPSEIGRGKDFAGFYEATLTKLEAPVEELLDQLTPPKPSVIIYDTFSGWVVRLGKRKNIPVASFFPQSAMMLSIFYHYQLIVQRGHANVDMSSEGGEELIDYIPGVAPIRVADLPTPINGKGKEVMHRVDEAVALVPEAQFLLIPTIYELEPGAIDALREVVPIPIYLIGLAIPCFSSMQDNSSQPEYIQWLDSQPKESVLYISQGSFLSASSSQLQEIVAGIQSSGVRFFWVARQEASSFTNGISSSSKGLVVPWCDQLKVLSHPSIGGFWSHCGWNSTRESIFSGLPMLTFPLVWDQVTNSKQIVEDWKIGLRVKKDDDEVMISRDEISELVHKFMDLETDEGKEMRRRAKHLQDICRREIGKGSSSEINIDAFIKGISIHN